MDFIKLSYGLFIFVASYQCCLGTITDYSMPVSRIRVRGVDRVFTDVTLTASNGIFSVTDPELNDMIGGQFTTSEIEFAFMYELRAFLVLFREDSTTICVIHFPNETFIKIFFWSIRSNQPRPEASSYLYVTAMLRYTRDNTALKLMKGMCHFHVQNSQKYPSTWQSFNFTELVNVDDGIYEALLIFLPGTYTVSEPLHEKVFALCIQSIRNEIFIVVFVRQDDAQTFYDTVKDRQNTSDMDTCEFPSLTDEQTDYMMSFV